jgi:GT2 family glycosyltransferase
MIGNDIADQRNKAVLQSEGDWIWFIDTDQIFAPETLERLLAHNVEMVQVLCLMRHPPHVPLMYEDSEFERPLAPSGTPRLVQVKSLGAGGTLYRKEVFVKIPGPWFEGVIGTEDTHFAQKARKAGFKLYVDTSTPVGHLTPMIIWPQYKAGIWQTRYDAMNGQSVLLPPVESRIVRPALKLAM